MELASLTALVKLALIGFVYYARVEPGMIVVFGCSSCVVLGKRIGSSSNIDIAVASMVWLLPVAEEHGIYLAFQCCDHLNRALVVDKECKDRLGLEEVTVLPHEDAG